MLSRPAAGQRGAGSRSPARRSGCGSARPACSAVLAVLRPDRRRITKPDEFLDTRNLQLVLTQASVIGVVTVGMTFVITCGGIDLSVGAIVALSSVWATTVATQEYGFAGILFTAVLVGLGCGLVNGVLIAYGGMVPFIATLAMLASARGLALQITDGKTQIVTVAGGPRPRSRDATCSASRRSSWSSRRSRSSAG